MSNEFNQGDTVRLNSGGPLMTVKSVDQENVQVTWFDDKDQLQTGDFNYKEVEHDDGMLPMPVMG